MRGEHPVTARFPSVLSIHECTKVKRYFVRRLPTSRVYVLDVYHSEDFQKSLDLLLSSVFNRVVQWSPGPQPLMYPLELYA